MATNPTGVKIFVGPANQLVLGDVVTGPAEVTLETIDESHQRLNFSIPSPTQELVDAVDASASSAAGAQTAAVAAQGSAANAATAAANSATSAATSATAASGAQTAATAAQTAAQAAVAEAAAAAAPTPEQLNEAVRATLLPSNLALDTDGVPFISPGANDVFVYLDTDGRPYFVS
jgi:hypothetical protein